LTFARWLVDRNSPTTARAFVNRMWQAYFATGLVATSEDLGKQSEIPSNPELLDWLAVEFMDANWSMKAIHRLIVTSAAYRQSSRVTPELYERDPYNRLLRVDRGFEWMPRSFATSLAASALIKIGGRACMLRARVLFVPPTSYGPKFGKKRPGRIATGARFTFRYRSVRTDAADFRCRW
jgi:hypothetical protein